MGKKKIFTSVQEAEVLRFCQDLVRIKSVNPPGDELPAAEFVASALEKAGLEVELIKHSATRPACSPA
jgi:acetylornithine deacetylase/succinyl-diaminopimelate desuccinylase-like protein